MCVFYRFRNCDKFTDDDKQNVEFYLPGFAYADLGRTGDEFIFIIRINFSAK